MQQRIDRQTGMSRMRRPRQGYGQRRSGGSPGSAGARPYDRVANKNEAVKIPSPGENLRIIPLGGVEEIGKNMMVVEYKDDIIVIDAGVQFSDSETPGIDYILPNVKYLEENKSKIRALII